MDDGLVSGAPPRQSVLLRELQSKRRRSRKELRSQLAHDQNPTQGHERWFLSLCAELLPTLSSRGAHGTTDRYFHVPPWIPVHRSGTEEELNRRTRSFLSRGAAGRNLRDLFVDSASS